ncbi:hypothetical protein MBLNU230_g1297t1 [Neophaeotheca triangularis]
MNTRKHGLMRVFWPEDVPTDDIPGVIVGWRNSELDIVVVGVLQGVEARNVENALRMQTLFRGSPNQIERILERCGGRPLQALGTLNRPKGAAIADAQMLSMHTTRKCKAPSIDVSAETVVTVQIITFEPPDPKRMEYLSLTPITLALEDKRRNQATSDHFDTIDKDEELEKIKKQKLVEKLKLHTVIKHPRTHKELALPTIIDQMNCAAEINALMQKNIGMVGIRMKRSLSVSERVVVSATNLWDDLLQKARAAFLVYIWPFASQVFILALMFQRLAAEGMLLLLDWRPLLPGATTLKDISATAQQVDIRLQQFCYWPAQYIKLRHRRNDWESITTTHPDYIRFFNSLWLVANDIIIGIALGSYVIENADSVGGKLDEIINDYSIKGLQRMIAWLKIYPAGLKLNNELAAFLGDLFLWVINYWNSWMSGLRPALPHIIRIIGVSSFAGASLPISLFSDLVSLLTIHIYSFYVASARIYNWQLTIIVSLFHLFRGKKRNVLRNRIDSCDYDLDQLLLGTILFTLLFFLLPTVAVFYATFASARIAIIALKAALDTWLACLNHFPLFAVMLRLKDSRRLPGGIRFELLQPPLAHLQSTVAAPTAYIKLKSVPLPLSQTFGQYAQLGHRLRKHYLSPHVLLGLISGHFVPPIHRKSLYSLQYSMLPAQRVSISELWQLLSQTDTMGGGSHTSGVASNGHVPNGKEKHGKSKKDGFWWSK